MTGSCFTVESLHLQITLPFSNPADGFADEYIRPRGPQDRDQMTGYPNLESEPCRGGGRGHYLEVSRDTLDHGSKVGQRQRDYVLGPLAD